VRVGDCRIVSCTDELFSQFHRPLDFALGHFPLERFAFVVELFTAREAQLDLGAAVLEIELERYQGKAALLGLAREPFDLALMQQQLSGAGRLVIELIRPGVGADVGVDQERLAFLHARVAVGQVGLAVTQRFYFAAHQNQTGFIGLVDEVIMACLPVDADNLLA
jgi:hypothetical protein